MNLKEIAFKPHDDCKACQTYAHSLELALNCVAHAVETKDETDAKFAYIAYTMTSEQIQYHVHHIHGEEC